jgi:tetratricopeptide (TPR) repeat protein
MLISCSHKTTAWDAMDKAENIMNSHPDSALVILSSIDKDKLGYDEDRARYALLLSMALDKNYVDTTTFDILKPAIDYYLVHGTADEKLRTLYYQGVIFLNKSDYDMAMDCYLKANDLNNEYSDTLTYANMLVAQGYIYAKACQIEDFVGNNLRASELYGKIGEGRRVFSSLLRALDGTISLSDKASSDSILSLADSLAYLYPELEKTFVRVKMSYNILFDSDSAISNILESITDLSQYDEETKLDFTLGYLKLHNPKKAKVIFDSIESNHQNIHSFKYISIKPMVLEANEEYRDALNAYKKFHLTVEAENSKIYSQKTTVAQDIHKLKIDHLYSLQSKDRQLWIESCVALVLIIITCLIYYRLRLGKKNQIISEQEQLRLQLENEKLQKQNSVLELEKHNAELECEKQNLAAENMRLKISQLEAEGEHLKKLQAEAKLSKPILDSIQERIGILNGLLAAKISDNDAYSKPYDKWISQITEDRKSFMDSTRLAFWASHPAFMKYLEDHGLTESEMNYVCLYAIGLRGKEVGEYIQIKRHYHTSTDIRNKLGLSENDTNLGIHIRNLMKRL